MENHFRVCLLLICLTGFSIQLEAQDSSTIRPIRHSLHPGGRQSLDGSLPNGGCTSVNDDGDICNLQDGGTSVLVDNTILPLNGLNGDWARGLYTVDRTTSFISIGFDFGTSVPVKRVELVLFNCQQWSIRAGSLAIYTDAVTSSFPRQDPVSVGTLVGERLLGVGINSCTNLYRVCVPLLGANNRIYYIVFHRASGSNRVYLAETIFYNDTRTCGDDTLVTEPVTIVTTTTEEATEQTVPTTEQQTETTQTEMTQAETTQTEMTQAETTQTEMRQTETTQTEMTQTETTQTEMTQAETTQTEMTQTETTQTEMTQAETTQTEMTQAETTQTEMTQAETTQTEMRQTETTQTIPRKTTIDQQTKITQFSSRTTTTTTTTTTDIAIDMCTAQALPPASANTPITSLIAAVFTTTLLATIIIVTLHILLYVRYRRLLTSTKVSKEIAAPADHEEATYEQIDETKHGAFLELKQNEAYGTARVTG